jgi:hypothetical protein
MIAKPSFFKASDNDFLSIYFAPFVSEVLKIRIFNLLNLGNHLKPTPIQWSLKCHHGHNNMFKQFLEKMGKLMSQHWPPSEKAIFQLVGFAR